MIWFYTNTSTKCFAIKQKDLSISLSTSTKKNLISPSHGSKNPLSQELHSYHRLESVPSHSTSKRSISEGKSLDRFMVKKDGWRPWNHNANEGQSRLAGESERPQHAHPPERLPAIPVSGWGWGGWQKKHLQHSASLNQSYFLSQDPSRCICQIQSLSHVQNWDHSRTMAILELRQGFQHNLQSAFQRWCRNWTWNFQKVLGAGQEDCWARSGRAWSNTARPHIFPSAASWWKLRIQQVSQSSYSLNRVYSTDQHQQTTVFETSSKPPCPNKALEVSSPSTLADPDMIQG